MKLTRLDHLLVKVDVARLEARNELERRFPCGTTVRFKISSAQRNWSTGVVEGLGYLDGYLQVKHNEAKPHSRYTYRHLHHSDLEPSHGD